MKLKIETLALIVFNLIVLGLIVSVGINTVSLAQINPDGSYYLSYSENMFKGYRPYTDMGLDYMPFVIYIFFFFKMIFNGIQYEHYLTIQILSYFLSGFLIYLIVLHFTLRNKIVSITAGFLFIGSIFTFDGIYIILEPYLIVFALLTVLLLIKANEKNNSLLFLFAGFFSICCFFCKQYGVLIYPAVAIYFLWQYYSKVIKLKNMFTFFMGIVTASILFLAFLFLIHRVEPSGFFYSIFKPQYVDSYPNLSINAFISFFRYSVFYVFPIIMLFPFIFIEKNSKHFPQVLLVIVAAASFFSVMIVRQYPHYFQLSLPFLIISIFILLEKTKEIMPFFKLIRLYHLAFLLMIFSMFITIVRLKQLNEYLIGNYSIKQTQLSNALTINKYIPARTLTTNLSATLSFSYLCELIPPDFKQSGFNFYLRNEQAIPNKTFEQIDQRIKPNILNSEFVLTDTISETSFPGVNVFLIQQQFNKIVTTNSGLSIWKKKY
ncbi:MAG: glycosyltransferase family 39 protein [Bacteroidetes bacterium]|nr:glycosyltransferase family 39 protein [Bacteroidota bacterium]